VLVAEDGTIIAGHGRVLAARKLRITDVPVMIASEWTDAQKRAYAIADNKLTLNGGWDEELLGLELGELEVLGFDLDLIGFTESEREALAAQFTEGLTDPDAVPDLPSDPITRDVDLWVLGTPGTAHIYPPCVEQPSRWSAQRDHLEISAGWGAARPHQRAVRWYCRIGPIRAHGSGCAVRCASDAALFDKFDAAGISVPPHHTAVLGRFEAIQ
jgi:hypothetical protein